MCNNSGGLKGEMMIDTITTIIYYSSWFILGGLIAEYMRIKGYIK